MKKSLPKVMLVVFPDDERKTGEIKLYYNNVDPSSDKVIPIAMSSPYGMMFKGLRQGCHNEVVKREAS